MKKSFFLIILLISSQIFAQPKFSDISGKTGSFSRMGFGARGIAMGNAMVAVTEGELVSYYNPAVTAFQEGNSINAAYSFLALDRKLNYINYTRRFIFGARREQEDSEDYSNMTGLTIGIINSGVSGIEERDNQGIKKGEISTSENLFFVGLSRRFSKTFILGLNVRFYYYSLYENISSTGLGFDVGIIYMISDNMNLGASVSDLNSAYKWDTNDLYGQQGRSTTDKFPMSKKIGFSYHFDEPEIITAIEFESFNNTTNFIKFGVEYKIFNNLFLRGGLDRLNISNSNFLPKPSLGFSYSKELDSWNIGIDYAFVFEPYTIGDQHIIGVNIKL
ncbi:MAG: hypothetical protein JW866_08855 [Ignavibacteriales bacterium]|nr:hypothetical protein [Ignavibacteriales bacterium]